MKGRKRHAAVDVLGLVLKCHVGAANSRRRQSRTIGSHVGFRTVSTD